MYPGKLLHESIAQETFTNSGLSEPGGTGRKKWAFFNEKLAISRNSERYGQGSL